MSQTSKSIWIVDDDKVYTYGVKKIIKSHLPSNEVTTYDNGKKALEHITKQVENDEELPDLILLDIDMPEMNGWEFLGELEKLGDHIIKKIQIFVISSRIEHDKDQLYKVEWDEKVSDFIRKPVQIEVLRSLVSQ